MVDDKFLPMSVEIDWEQQWSHHAYNFRDGKAHIPLTSEITIELEPGPGFGDFSHPTTRLMIEMMSPFVANRSIFDIGCGSGILSISAALLGANSVYICDIDPEAIEHANRNAAVNGVLIKETQPKSSDLVVLMNMISSEQEIAWAVHKVPFSILITSGILKADRSKYLTFARSNGWQVQQETELDGWLGFVFKENHK